jgi:Ca-activated chloride channel family protein
LRRSVRTLLAALLIAPAVSGPPLAASAQGLDPRPQPGASGVAPVPGTGALQLLDADGRPAGSFPLRHTEIHAEVTGSIARVVVEQEFQNPYRRGIEAVYVFPLPHASAVDDLEMRIGDRIVRGEIRTRRAARETYEQAKQQGRLAALLDQERPNIFTQQVANIQPGHSIRVRICYVDMLEYHDGGYEMVIPTVVGPRFIPGQPLAGGGNVPASVPPLDDDAPHPDAGESGTGWSPDTDRVPDASRITPPVVLPGRRAGHDIQIRVELDAGVPLQRVECPSHAVDLERPGPAAARLRLQPADTIPNKDFVLRYRVASERPELGFLSHRDPRHPEGYGYFSLAFQPELEVTAREARPKEIIFILDTSGSMRGEPMARSKAAMRWALQHLDPDDTFQIIRFSDEASSFSPRPVRCTTANVQRGLLYVEQMEGSGGTQMLSGIEAALDLPLDAERLRIVCMLTDGYIGNETEILGAVRQKIGDARLYSFGIGAAVNHYLLDEMAEEGRGMVDYVPLDGDTRPIVERFYARIARPHLTDIAIDWGDLDVQGVYPARVPDLFAGRPLVLAGRYQRPGRGEIVVRGRLGRRPFERRLPVELPADAPEHAPLGTLWARRRIDSLMQRLVGGEDSTLVAAVTDVALSFHLMTRYTSFVAVDNQVVAKGKPVLVPQLIEMPAGVSYEGVFGEMNLPPSDKAIRLGASAVRVVGHPVEGVREAGALNTGVVVQGGELHVRGGRSGEINVRVPTPATPAPPPVANFSGKPNQIDVKSDVSHDSQLSSTDLEVRVQPECGHVLRGDRIRISITIRNASKHDIAAPSYLTAADLVLRVERDGRVIGLRREAFARPWRTTPLASGATRTYRLVLGERPADYAAPGRYDIQLVGIGTVALTDPRARCKVVVQ